jgi:hypothetical protein
MKHVTSCYVAAVCAGWCAVDKWQKELAAVRSAHCLILLCAVFPLFVQDGVQPLHICAEKGHREVAAVLITAGAAPNTKDSVSHCINALHSVITCIQLTTVCRPVPGTSTMHSS